MLKFKCDLCSKTEKIITCDTAQYYSMGIDIRINLQPPIGWTKVNYHIIGIDETALQEKLLCPNCANKLQKFFEEIR